jgi:hypothetical protein
VIEAASSHGARTRRSEQSMEATMNSERSNSALTLLAGAGIGAALMYFLDPDRGNGRRHLVADQTAGFLRTRKRDAAKAMRDARNHAAGVVAEARGRFEGDRPTNEQLAARVRSAVGHHAERARGVQVEADAGLVTLRGEVPASEMNDVIAAAERVRGVTRVENQLTAFAGAPQDTVRLD